MQSRGKFITFEGIEGSGKSLQLRMVSERLQKEGIPYLLTLEPGGTALGRELRKLLLRTEGAPRAGVTELLLYLADRYQHVHEVVEPALAAGRNVLSDRYHDATLAYQGHARGLGMEWTDGLARYLNIPRPDLTLLFDVPVEVGLGRARVREHQNNSEMGRFEAESIEFHQRVREGYLLLAKQESGRFISIDGAGEPDAVFERVIQCLIPRLRT